MLPVSHGHRVVPRGYLDPSSKFFFGLGEVTLFRGCLQSLVGAAQTSNEHIAAVQALLRDDVLPKPLNLAEGVPKPPHFFIAIISIDPDWPLVRLHGFWPRRATNEH
jgi:hypothetical protein